MIDTVALMIDKSTEKIKSVNYIAKSLGIMTNFKNMDDILNNSNNSTKDFALLK